MRSVLAWMIKHWFTKLYIPWSREASKQELVHFEHSPYRAYVVLTYTPWALSNYFIKGKYKHAELVVGPHNMVGARTDGYKMRTIKHVLGLTKRYAILEPVNCSAQQRNLVANYAVDKSDDNIRYDFEMDLKTSDALYCTEAVCRAYNEAIGRTFTYGKLILPDELLEDKKNWKVVKEVKC